MNELDKAALLTPTRAKRDSTIGVDHSGRPKGIPQEPAHHGPSLARATEHHVHENIALSGKPKNHMPVAVHSNMRSRIAPLGGMIKDVHGAPDASSPQYLDIEPRNPSKQNTVKTTPGMRSRISSLDEHSRAEQGRNIIDEGLEFAGPDHPTNLERKFK